MSCNQIALYLAVIVLPPEEFIDILMGPSQLVVSPGEVLAFTMASMALLTILSNPTKRSGAFISFKVTAWCLASCVFWSAMLVIAMAFTHRVIWSNVHSFVSTAVFLIPLLASVRYLLLKSETYRGMIVFLTIISVSLNFMPVWLDMLVIAIPHLPDVYDPVLFRFNAILGLGWTSCFADLLRWNPVLHSIVSFNYDQLAVWSAAAAASESYYKPGDRTFIMLGTSILGLIGYLLYFFMPAIDPACFFGTSFPDGLPVAASLPMHAVVSHAHCFRNTMPSVHAGAALLLFAGLRNSPFWHRCIGALVLLSTFISTLGLGEHYAVDWFAAFPLVLLARALSAVSIGWGTRARRNAVIAGTGLLLCWVAAVRLPALSLANAWLLGMFVIISVGLSVRLECRLAKFEEAVACSGARRLRTTFMA